MLHGKYCLCTWLGLYGQQCLENGKYVQAETKLHTVEYPLGALPANKLLIQAILKERNQSILYYINRDSVSKLTYDTLAMRISVHATETA